MFDELVFRNLAVSVEVGREIAMAERFGRRIAGFELFEQKIKGGFLRLCPVVDGISHVVYSTHIRHMDGFGVDAPDAVADLSVFRQPHGMPGRENDIVVAGRLPTEAAPMAFELFGSGRQLRPGSTVHYKVFDISHEYTVFISSGKIQRYFMYQKK